MIDRLQFRHHNEVFDLREDAIAFITTGAGYSISGASSDEDLMKAGSLFAEPTVLAYKNITDADPTGEVNPHVIIAIGSRTNPGMGSEAIQWSDNSFCIIDIDEVKGLIDEHYDEFLAAVKSLALIPKNTDTLNLYAFSSETGTFISGDVKTEERFVFSEDSVSVKNNLMVTENGLFMYVSLKYDEEKEQFTFSVSNADKTLSSTTITLPNNYITGGSYDVKDESIHLNLRNGDEVVISCENLIGEWAVESSASTTPIVLTRERVYDGESELIQPWQDVLRADVRIDNEAEDNILEKSWDGTRLKVDGKASKISCWRNGEKITVQEALNDLNNLKVSNDSRNIIFKKVDGIFSTVDLKYKPTENKLLFTVSGRGISGEPTVTTEEIQLNTISLFKSVWYDSITEELVIEWIDDSGNIHYERISIGQMLQEWEPQNEGHNVAISRVRSIEGKDKVSADAKIARIQPNNILEDVNHELYVNGTASNIKYDATGDTNVKQVLDNLSANTTFLSGAIDSVSAIVDTNIERIDKTIGSGFTDNSHENITAKFEALSDKLDIEIISARSEEHRIEEKLNDEIDRSTAKDDEHDGKIQAIEDEIGDGFSPRNTVRDEIDNLQSEIDAISGETSAKLKDIDSDNSINIDKTDTTIPKISVALSDEKEYDIENIIKLESDGLYAGVDLDIVSGASGNVLVFKSTNGIKEIPLKTNSVIDKIWYDPYREAIIIEYTVNGQRMPDVVVPVGDLIDEWEVESGHPFAIQLNRKRVSSGSTGHDILSASAITSSDSDNILIIKDNALKVSNVDIVANTNAIAQEIQDRIADVDEEEDRAKAEELILTNKIGTGFTTADTNNVTAKFNALNTAINNEVTRATDAEQLITNNLQSEFIRATSAETALQTAINNEVSRSTNKDDEHDNKIAQLRSDLTAEINRSTSEDTALRTDLTAETTRASNAETALQTAINSANTRIDNEIATARSQEEIISGLIVTEITTARHNEDELRTAINNEVVRASNAEQLITNNLTAETTRATSAETALNTAITTTNTNLANEITDRTTADAALQNAIDAEKERAKAAEQALSDRIDDTTLTFVDTNTIDFTTATTTTGLNVTADVRVPSSDNIIKIDQGIKANVDLTYNEATNTLTFTKTSSSGNVVTNIPLNAGSIIDEIRYDSGTKELVIRYHSSSSTAETITRVPVADMFNEWDVDNSSTNSAIRLTKTAATTAGGVDKLSGEVLISPLDSNILTIDTNGLYVDGSGIISNSEAIASLRSDLTAEITRSTAEDARLNNVISAETSARQAADSSLRTDLTAEVNRAQGAEATLTTAISNEVIRAQNVEAELRTAITNEVTDRTTDVSRIETLLANEITARTAADTLLQTSINSEIARAQAAESQLNDNLNAEIARATTAETNLYNMITAETHNRIASDDALDARIDSLTGQIATNTANITSNTTRITALESRTTTLETNTGTNANNIATLSGQVTANTSNISTLNTNVTNLTTRVTTNETDIAQLKINTATNATNISTLNTNVNNLTTQVNTNTNNITALSASTGNLQTQITNVNNSVTALTSEVNDLENRVSTNETNISHLQAFSGNVASSRLTIQKNGVTVATYAPTASTTANIEVPTSLSQLTNNLNKLTWSLGTPTADTTGYNGSDGKNITIPSELSHLNASSIKTLTITTNDGTTTTTAGTYNPTNDATINIAIPSLGNLKTLTWANGTANTGTYNGSSNTTLNVPSSMQHLSEYSSGVYTIAGAINLSGNLTASSIYSSSDVNLKENIALASVDKKFLANHIEVKEFNFKDDPNKTKVYGVIAQEVEAAGLNDVVITKEDGYKAVDYTSLMMLKIAYLEKENKHFKDKLTELEERLEKLENKQ